MVDDAGPDSAGLPEVESPESGPDGGDGRRKRSTAWALIALIILLFIILWLFCEYWGSRKTSVSNIKPAIITNDIQMPGASTTPSGTTPQPSLVPDVVGMERSAAVGVLEAAGYVASVTEVYGTSHPENTVFRQSPLAGSALEQGGTVGILVQVRSSSAPMVRVPDVTGLTQSAAESKLKALGFNIVLSYFPVYKNPGRIHSQWPPAGESRVQGSDVQIQVTVKP